MNTLHTPFSSLNLDRHPPQKNDTLRAWDAADELTLNHLAESASQLLPSAELALQNTLIINDAFGALSCSLHHLNPVSWSDSHISHTATAQNLQTNELLNSIQYLPSTHELSGTYDYVFIKVPKTLALLEHQLAQLKPHLHASSLVIGACMTKYLHKSHLNLFEQYIGPTTTSLAVKKARLILANVDSQSAISPSPFPTCYHDNELNLSVCNHANVFSREKLDIGTRVMVEQFAHLPDLASLQPSIVDLGCGNGLLGIMAKKHYDSLENNTQSHVSFIDESYMAIASAKENYIQAFSTNEGSEYFISNSFEQTSLNNVDLILCNPPFHQSHTLGSHIATQMFKHSKNVLKKGGQLWVIGNRHLNYNTTLKRLFGNCHTIANHKKFQVFSSIVR